MLSATSCGSRLSISILIAASASFLLVFFLFSESLSGYAYRAKDYWETAKHSSPVSTQVYNCEDPYRRPGYLYIDEDDYKSTQWIPFTDDFLDADVPDAAYPVPEGKDIVFNVTQVEPAFLEARSSPQQWMQMAVAEDKRRRDASDVEFSKQKATDFLAVKDEGNLGWLWGQRVLIIGDSVDRFMVQFFCEEMGRRMQQPMAHATATCAIPTLNLTLTHWHFSGSWPNKPDWWWMKDMEDIPFEERWETIWAPTLDKSVRGAHGRPDLLLWQNCLWDQRALWEGGEAHYDISEPLGQRERQLAWEEIRFVAARLKKFVQRVASEFGPEMPLMYRAATMHRDSNATDANLHELDRLSRAVAERAGQEVFEWGRITTSFSMLYKDNTHTGKGPGSWLFGNMMLEYLARGAAVGDPKRSPYFDGWDKCHESLVKWGGR